MDGWIRCYVWSCGGSMHYIKYYITLRAPLREWERLQSHGEAPRMHPLCRSQKGIFIATPGAVAAACITVHYIKYFIT